MDWIEPVEAAYELDRDLAGWMERMCEQLHPLFQSRIPAAVLMQFTGGRFMPIAGAGPRPELVRVLQHSLAASSNSLHKMIFASGTNLVTVSQQFYGEHPEERERYLELTGGRFQDSIGLVASIGGGRSLVLSAPLAEVRSISRAEQRRGAQLAAHLGAGLRLHLAVSTASRQAAPEAVLSGDGKLHDARGEAESRRARDWLRDAVKNRERARTREQRSDSDRALSLWEGLVAGRWSLVDRFESDGKRFVIAYQNDPEVGDPRGLSRRERQVAEYLGLGRSQKEIAYLLGVGAAAVSNAVAGAIDKLGLGGRAELANIFAPHGLRARLSEVDIAGETLAVGAAPLLDETQLARLSDSEQDVALDLLRGATTSAIAERRGSSLLTVDTQVKAIFAKLRVGSRIELAAQLAAPESLSRWSRSGE